MTGRITFKEHNFCLIDFYKIIKKCEPDLITSLYNCSLLKGKITKDTKALLLHYIILELCNIILKNKGKEKNVIYYSSVMPTDLKLCEYFDQAHLSVFLGKTIEKLKKNLPIRFYCSELPFSKIEVLANGERGELISKIMSYINNNDYSSYSFSKVYSFTHRYNLTFLNKEYFNSIKARQLLIA